MIGLYSLSSPARGSAAVLTVWLVVLCAGWPIGTGWCLEQQPEAVAAAEPAATQPAAATTGGSDQPPLVTLATAAEIQGRVLVSGTVDHASLQRRQVGDQDGFAFELVDPAGNRLLVTGEGWVPRGFARTSVVVVAGRGTGSRFQADSVLIPGSGLGLAGVATITLLIWLGLFAYVFWLDRRTRKLESA